MKMVLLTATVQSHIAQFHRPLADVLHENGYEIHVAAKNNLGEKNGLKLDFADKVFDVPFSRSPKSIDNIKAYFQLKEILSNNSYEVIHCNTPVGGIITRLAAMNARKHGTKVFYTAHGFHFYKGAPKMNWIVFYPIEKLMARFCDTLITITKEDYQLARRKLHTNVEYIHGVGVYTERYHAADETEQLMLRKKENLRAEDFVILCTGELNQNKNQATLIATASKLKEDIPHLKVLLAGNGPLGKKLQEQINILHLEETVKLIGYRSDLENITPAVDLVVSCSFREGLPLNIIEAMLCKKAVVVSKNRGHEELVRNGFNGYIVSPDNIKEYCERIIQLCNNRILLSEMGDNAYRTGKLYTTDIVKQEFVKIYGLE